MSFPFAAQPVQSTNPIEIAITSLNSNPYFIGGMMLLLNLGGRHLASGLTPEQDKFFQHPLFRKLLIFVVFFIGTRNFISSIFMTIVFTLFIGYLFNDQSILFLFKPSTNDEPVKEISKETKTTPPINIGLTPEESDIHTKLSQKIERSRKEIDTKDSVGQNLISQITNTYSQIMNRF